MVSCSALVVAIAFCAGLTGALSCMTGAWLCLPSPTFFAPAKGKALQQGRHILTTVVTPDWLGDPQAAALANCSAKAFGFRAGLAPVIAPPQGAPYNHMVKLLAVPRAMVVGSPVPPRPA